MSATLNGSSALQCFEHSDVVEIRNRVMFDFYPGLPHIKQTCELNSFTPASIPYSYTASSHEINSHEINCHKVNSHKINLSLD